MSTFFRTRQLTDFKVFTKYPYSVHAKWTWTWMLFPSAQVLSESTQLWTMNYQLWTIILSIFRTFRLPDFRTFSDFLTFLHPVNNYMSIFADQKSKKDSHLLLFAAQNSLREYVQHQMPSSAGYVCWEALIDNYLFPFLVIQTNN